MRSAVETADARAAWVMVLVGLGAGALFAWLLSAV
jgi:hypothetical protein